MSLDIGQMLTGIPSIGEDELTAKGLARNFDQGMGAAAGLLDVNPAVGYSPTEGFVSKAPEKVSDSPVLNAMHNLGRLFQAGTGTGDFAGPGAVITQALADVPVASRGMGTLMGVRTADRNKLEQLDEFLNAEARGMGDRQMRDRFGGWFRDKDLQPKYEIPDTHMQFTSKFGQVLDDTRAGGSIIPATKFWDAFYHPELKRAGEDILSDIKVYPSSLGWDSGQRGAFNPSSREMTLELPPIASGPVNWDDILKTAGHETQHSIAYSHPNWAGGANPTWVDIQRYAHQPKYGDALSAYTTASGALADEIYAARRAWFDKQLEDKNPESKMIWQAFKDLSEAPMYSGGPDELFRFAELLKKQPVPVQNQLQNAVRARLKAAENLYQIPYGKDSAFDLYAAKLDEANARTVERRMGMTPEALIEEAFWETRDKYITPHDRIIPFYDFSVPRKEVERARLARPGER